VKREERKRHGKIRHRYEENIERETKGNGFEDVICNKFDVLGAQQCVLVNMVRNQMRMN